MTRYALENFGCRTSQADGDSIGAALDRLGARRAQGIPEADVIVVNTCTVTAEADRDARALIRRAHRNNPAARIVVTGCYAQRAPEEIAALAGVWAVVGNSHKHRVADLAMGLALPSKDLIPAAAIEPARSAHRPLLLSDDIFAHSDFILPSVPAAVAGKLAAHGAAERTRPTLKIQDGCGNRCTFCVIPAVRGNSRSQPAADVLRSASEFAATGGRELVLSGINLGRWGRDLTPAERFEDLVAAILSTTALPRLRLSSVEPMDWTPGLIALFEQFSRSKHPRLARHIHMPLQSGSDAVLRRMHRRYRPWHYAERLAAAAAAVPGAALGADVMVGFPGESDREFQETCDFITAQPFTYLHLFPFSARPGTPGWHLHQEQPVAAAAVRARMTALRNLIEEKSRRFRARFVAQTLSAVTLMPDAAGKSSALTDNFLAVELDRPHAPNTLLSVQITGLSSHGLAGAPAGYGSPMYIHSPSF